jgi:hypothetical protein
MQRLCERPGCSEVASVAYGMRPEDLVFWLDALSPSEGADGSDPGGRGALCRRHADSMVVPRNWTLDDLRDPDLHLFRPPSVERGERRAGRSRTSTRGPSGEQLALGVDPDPVEQIPVDPAVVEAAQVEPAAAEPAAVEAAAAEPAAVEAAPDAPWTPSFDADDDLDGLLAARSPLLARAFRGSDRTDGR